MFHFYLKQRGYKKEITTKNTALTSWGGDHYYLLEGVAVDHLSSHNSVTTFDHTKGFVATIQDNNAIFHVLGQDDGLRDLPFRKCCLVPQKGNVGFDHRDVDCTMSSCKKLLQQILKTKNNRTYPE